MVCICSVSRSYTRKQRILHTHTQLLVAHVMGYLGVLTLYQMVLFVDPLPTY